MAGFANKGTTDVTTLSDSSGMGVGKENFLLGSVSAVRKAEKY